MIRKTVLKITSSIILFILILTINISYFSFEIASASEKQSSDLIERISKDFTKKFCNSIGFGLSKESAMNFSFAENNKIFEKRKGMESLNKELLANKIAFSVINGCGYQLDLYGDEDIQEFANLYLSLN